MLRSVKSKSGHPSPSPPHPPPLNALQILKKFWHYQYQFPELTSKILTPFQTWLIFAYQNLLVSLFLLKMKTNQYIYVTFVQFPEN